MLARQLKMGGVDAMMQALAKRLQKFSTKSMNVEYHDRAVFEAMVGKAADDDKANGKTDLGNLGAYVTKLAAKCAWVKLVRGSSGWQECFTKEIYKVYQEATWQDAKCYAEAAERWISKGGLSAGGEDELRNITSVDQILASGVAGVASSSGTTTTSGATTASSSTVLNNKPSTTVETKKAELLRSFKNAGLV
ncbi:unnamed protein product, partial [Amoebophrya sp. A120]|eukprot:GSA120T00011874001.1